MLQSAAALVLFALGPSPGLLRAVPPATCPIVDAIAPLDAVAARTAGQSDADQLAAYKEALIGAHPGLYAQDVLGLTPGPGMDRLILASLAQARRAPDRDALKARVREQVGATVRAFHRAFADFSCNFPVYLTDSLGALDGAGRVVDGQPAMVLGIGSIELEKPHMSLAVFLHHEFFHRYHFEAAGFSDDPAEHQAIWRALWAEGLATYVSRALTPGASTADALLSENLEERARPLMPQMAAELLDGLDRLDKDLFFEYFTSGVTAGKHGIPARAGYYVGYIVAARLAERHSLNALAHLKGDMLHAEIADTLHVLATYGAVARPAR